MAKFTLILFLSVLIPLISSQCTLEKAQITFRRSIYEFSTELASRLARDSENHFIMSPLSIWTLIAAISEGAEYLTMSEIQHVLKLHPHKCFNNKYFEIVKDIVQNTGGATLERTGALIFDEQLQVKEGFKRKVSKIGLCEVLNPSFDNLNDVANTINSFVSGATHGAIDEVVTPEDLENKQLLMIDAIFFKGQWKVPFSSEDTEISTFYGDLGQVLGDVNLMFKSDDYYVAEIDRIQAKVLELPYSSERFSMLVFLPYTDVPLAQVIEGLRDLSLQSIFNLYAQKSQHKVMVQLPRFKIESNLDNMIELLNDMGLNDMFETSATFPDISDYPLYVANLIQKASVEVTEEGTEASAVSEAGFESRVLPEQFVANKPFLFMIVDKTTQIVLFTGAYSKPSVF